MTARITSAQLKQLKRFMEDGLDALTMSKDSAQRVIAQGGMLQERLRALVLEMSGEYCNLLTDEEAVAWIVKNTDKTAVEVKQIVNGFRKEARRRKVADTVKLHAQVLAGCQFKRDMAKMGPCWQELNYLQDWNFQDLPTEHALVSWIPVPLADSTSRNVIEQTAVVASFKTEAGLPAWYEVSFGSVNHVSGLALAHFKATGSDPFNGLVVRTDTCLAAGGRLRLFWRVGRLCCGGWGWSGGDRRSNLTVYAVGVIKALGR